MNVDFLEEKENKILGFINSKEYKPMKIKDIMNFMEVPEKDRENFISIVENIINNGEVILNKKQKIVSLKSLGAVLGIYSSAARGFGFVTIENSEEKRDVFISSKNSNGAMHKDKVICKITSTSGSGKNYEGEIIKVVKKGYNFIVGTFQENKGFGFVVPDEKKLNKDIFISKKHSMGAVSGHKVVVEVTKDSVLGKNPEGKVIEILGHINDPGVDILSIIKQFELPSDFEDNVYEEIENIPDIVKEDETFERVDFRNLLTVTIDGEDAKDLDDAISIEKLSNNNFKLGVHIADVTNYVLEDSELDKEALKRGTSVYLVDRVIPMLPHKLSNGICSLNEGVDRLSLSCVMEINSQGEVISHEIVEGLINVNKRMSYTIVNDILTNSESEFLTEYKDFINMFKLMEELRNILLKRRIKRGSIEFEFNEPKIILDENRKPVEIKIYERNVATSIIEEFMLISNEIIAEHFFWLELPFIYRSHEEPDAEKFDKMADFISKFGYNLKGSTIHSKAIQDILLKSKNTEEEGFINRVILRSFKQARYTFENHGHFGLAAKYYCHFTSPIRRYPDLQIHRIIKYNIKGVLTQNKLKKLSKNMPDIAKKCSAKERVAEMAERETYKVKKVEFMEDKIGQVFKGIISGITSWGIYVELYNTVEGLVSIATIEDDNYYFDEENLEYIGEKTGNTYSMGNKVEVVVSKVNLQEKTIDFKFHYS